MNWKGQRYEGADTADILLLSALGRGSSPQRPSGEFIAHSTFAPTPPGLRFWKRRHPTRVVPGSVCLLPQVLKKGSHHE